MSCAKKKLFYFYRIVVVMLLLEVSMAFAGPLYKHPTNGRYFTDGSGKAIYLTGLHYWSNFQGWGTLHPLVDFTEHLNLLQSYNNNMVRLWVADTAWVSGYFGGQPAACEPQPFVRTGPGNALVGGLKFNLNNLNQAYFDKLSQCVSAASARGMYVIVMLFDTWGVGGYGNLPGEWPGSPFNSGNNINSINGDPNSDGRGIEIHTLAIPAVTSIQEAYVRKVIDTVNGFDNVLYEIINEGHNGSKDWQYHFIDYIKTYEAGKPKQHPVGINFFDIAALTPFSYLTDSNADFISPRNGNQEDWASNPPPADGSKVIVLDTDHFGSSRPSWVWKSFTRGYNPILMDDYGTGELVSWYTVAEQETMRKYMGYTLTYANKMNLAAMTPQGGLASTGYCLAGAGEYLAYQPGSGAFTLSLAGASGTLSVEWFNPATGITNQGSNVTGGTTITLTPPFSGEAVAYLTGGTPTTSYNLAKNKTTTAQTTYTPGNYGAANAVDGNIFSYWSSLHTDGPHWLRVDLGSTVSIDRVKVFWAWENIAANYQIQTSLDGSNFTTVATVTNQQPFYLSQFTATNARYVRVYCIQRVAGNYGYGLQEIEVYAPGTPLDPNVYEVSLAYGKPAVALNSYSSAYLPANAVDGSPTKSWSSPHGAQPSWIYVDLQQTCVVTSVSIVTKPTSRATTYDIDFSNDAQNWTTVVQAVNPSSTPTGYDDAVIETHYISGSRTTRYVRINGKVITPTYGMEIYELNITGGGGGGTDTTPPGAPSAVRDGTSTSSDIDSTYSTTQLSANWAAATDPESSVSYSYAIGTSAGGTNVAGWTANSGTSVTKTGTFTVGQAYYFSVKAVSAGGESAAANSDGQTVEAGGPTTYISDLSWVTSSNGWGPVEKDKSLGENLAGDGRTITLNGVTYAKGLGCCPASEIVYNLNGQYGTFECVVGVDDEVGLNGSVTFEVWVDNVKQFDSGVMTGSTAGRQVNVPVSGANTLKLVVTNGGDNINYDHADWADARLVSAVTDTTPPSAPGTVRDGTGATDINSTMSRTQLSANWTAATDAQSGISGYNYAIGSSPAGTNVAGWTALGNVLTATKTGLTLTIGTTYYFSVKAVNGAGLSGPTANSNGQVVLSTAVTDTTAPSAPGTVRDGPTAGTDASFTYSTTTLSANWTAATDSESGISGYQYAIGTSPGSTDVASWISNGANLTATKTGLTLTIGTTYYFSVKAVNGAGLSGPTANSNGQYVNAVNTQDTTAPSNIAQVRDGGETGIDAGVTYLTDELSANWDAAEDAESGISRYLYAIGTAPGAVNITNWKDNGALTEVTETGLTLTMGTTYYFSVKAENGVSLQSDLTSSDGQLVLSMDSQGPLISNVSAQGVTNEGATIAWETDEPSTSRVEYGLTAIYGSLTGEYIGMNTAHSVNLTGLLPITQYHFRVISRDYAGNGSTSVDFSFTTLSTPNELTEVKAYPNPCDFSNGQVIKFKVQSSEFGDIKIYTMSGKLVRKLTIENGAIDATWDGTNEDDQKVARGVYLYQITGSNGDKTTGKIATIR